MQPFKIILAEALQGEEAVPVVTAHSLSFQFQNYGLPGQPTNDLSEGNFTIDGKQSLLLAGGKTMEANLPPISVRLQEKQALIPTLEGAAKAKAEAEVAIWSAFQSSVQAALTTALQAQYQLDNPEGGQGE